MGSASSKVAKAVPNPAAQSIARKYPTRSPPQAPKSASSTSPSTRISTQESQSPPQTEPTAQPPSEHIDGDPGLAARLQSLGPVQPNPTYSPSSTFSAPSSAKSPSYPTTTTTSSTSQPQPATASQFQPSASSPLQTIFPSAAQNPAVSLLTARYRLAEEADTEFGRIGKSAHQGRQFLDVLTIRQILVLREKGRTDGEIEGTLGLKHGVVGRFGAKGVVGVGGIMDGE